MPGYQPINSAEISSSVPPSSTRRICSWLYAVGGTLIVGATTYLGSKYYLTTTEKILTQQLPVFEQTAARVVTNTLGVPGTSIRYLSQIFILINTINQIIRNSGQSEKSFAKKIAKSFAFLCISGCAGLGAYTLARIQAEEYNLEYDPVWLSMAIPLFLGSMEAVEALLGGLDIDNIKKLLHFIKTESFKVPYIQHIDSMKEPLLTKASTTSYSTLWSSIQLPRQEETASIPKGEGGIDESLTIMPETVIPVFKNTNNFPKPLITFSITTIGVALILFSFITIIDELRRNVLTSEENTLSAGNIALFTASVLGSFPQALLDLEKLSELLQKTQRKEIYFLLGTASLLFSSAAATLSFIMGYEFLGESKSHNASVASGVFAALPKIITNFVFTYEALEYSLSLINKSAHEVRKYISGEARKIEAPPTSLPSSSLVLNS